MLAVARDCFQKHPEDIVAEGKTSQLVDMMALRQIESEEWDDRLKRQRG